MDLAKITATVLTHGGSPRDYVGDDKIPGPVWPLLCVPTTAGTGSEVSAASETDCERGVSTSLETAPAGERRAVLAGVVLGEDEGLDAALRYDFRASSRG